MSKTDELVEHLRREVARGAGVATVRRLLRILVLKRDGEASRLKDPRPLAATERADIAAEVQDVVYAECVRMFEELEAGGHLGNGHHVAQAVAMAAKEALEGRWPARKDENDDVMASRNPASAGTSMDHGAPTQQA